MRRVIVLLMLSVALSGASWAQSDVAAADASKLRAASVQYEIIQILLEKREYSQILPEFRKILSLQLKGENELPVVQGAWLIAENLRKSQQFSLAEQLVDETLLRTEQGDNKFSLWMLKGKILRDQGRLQEAIEVYRKAQQFAPLRESPPDQ